MANRDEIVADLDELLDISSIEDSSLNGLQVEGVDEVLKVGLSVDAAQGTIDAAVENGCQLLIVHHGLFWGPQVALTGMTGRRVRACFDAGMSVYAAHLPLDAHPEVGNNVLLAQALGGTVESTFGMYNNLEIGVLAKLDPPADPGGIAGRLAALGCEEPLIWSFGPDEIRTLAVVTGRGNSVLEDAVAAGADCFVSGEPIHEAYHQARDHGIHCIYGGHYATEVFGVRALGERLVEMFGVETVWIDHPTGI
jgi:dinuclear metal center YbgI/SA1388 family protein